MSRTPTRSKKRVSALSKARLEEMIEAATADAYGESEQVLGWHVMLEEHLALPFETSILGAPTMIERVDLTGRDQIVAICSRGRHKLRVPILDVPLPAPRPEGAEWIEAYRRWCDEG
jgi:hypothetical protein